MPFAFSVLPPASVHAPAKCCRQGDVAFVVAFDYGFVVVVEPPPRRRPVISPHAIHKARISSSLSTRSRSAGRHCRVFLVVTIGERNSLLPYSSTYQSSVRSSSPT